MKKGFLFLMVLMLVTLTACNSGGSNANSNNEVVKTSTTEFTSEQDVKDFCYGKTFKMPYMGVSTTADANIEVKSFSGSIAVVCVYFDMSEVYGRAVQSGVDFEINKVTGEYWQKKDPADENNPFR